MPGTRSTLKVLGTRYRKGQRRAPQPPCPTELPPGLFPVRSRLVLRHYQVQAGVEARHDLLVRGELPCAVCGSRPLTHACSPFRGSVGTTIGCMQPLLSAGVFQLGMLYGGPAEVVRASYERGVTPQQNAWAGDAGNRFSRFSQPLALHTLQHAAATLRVHAGSSERQPPRRRWPTLRSWSLSRVCAHARLRRCTASSCVSRGVCSWRCPWCVSRNNSRLDSVPACGAVGLTPLLSLRSPPRS
jgi:hypothetical protein